MKPYLLFILLCTLAAAGCSRTASIHRYYLLETPEVLKTTEVTSDPLSAATCEIMPVEIHPAFASDRIALRTESHELIYYVYHKWAVRPEANFNHLLEHYLQNKRIFAVAAIRLLETAPDFRLQVRIHRLEVIRGKNKMSAHLQMESHFINRASRMVAVHHTFERTVSLQENDLNLFAEVTSQVFHEGLAQLANEIVVYMRDHDLKYSDK